MSVVGGTFPRVEKSLPQKFAQILASDILNFKSNFTQKLQTLTP